MLDSIIFLYVKTHNKTGKKYLGQTKRDDPFSYPGSGVRWTQHRKQHGDDVSTTLIAAFDSMDDLKIAGMFWSRHWKIVESEDWLNLIEETGGGGRGLKRTKCVVIELDEEVCQSALESLKEAEARGVVKSKTRDT